MKINKFGRADTSFIYLISDSVCVIATWSCLCLIRKNESEGGTVKLNVTGALETGIISSQSIISLGGRITMQSA